MKKNLLYLFTLVCSLGLFAGCGSDDDDDPVPPPPPEVEDWKDLSKKYEGNALAVMIGENGSLAVGNVEVNATSAEAATIKLNYLIPEKPEVTVDAKLSKANELYSLAGEAKINDNSTIAIKGNFDAEGKLAITIDRKLSSDITGNLAIQTMQLPSVTGFQTYVPVHWKIVTGNEETDAQLQLFGNFLGMMIGGKVDAVNVMLPANGTFDVNWLKKGEETVTGIPEEIKGLVKLYYVVDDGKLYLAMEKGVLALAEMFAPVIEEKLGVKLEQIVALLTDMGGFYGIPLAYSTDEKGVITFKMTKDQVLPFIQLLTPIILPNLSEEMRPMMEKLMQVLPLAEELELGLPFVKK